VMQPLTLLVGAVAAYAVAGGIGIYLIASVPNGHVLAMIILVGGILGIFYTANPFAFKYHALGDLAVFISFGPAMTLGAYFVQAQHLSWSPVLYAIPVGFLVDAVLHSNNLRDMTSDGGIKMMTLAMLLGERNSRAMYDGLLVGSYVSVFVLVVFSRLPAISLITLFSLPLAIRLMKTVRRKDLVREEAFAGVDAATAQLHSAFGALFIASLLIKHFVIH
jgi:1,4-dihydroxy-2-naphthoate octaprenyltransferase